MRMPGFTGEANLNDRSSRVCGSTKRDVNIGQSCSERSQPGAVEAAMMANYCYLRSYACGTNEDGSFMYCLGTYCTRTGWERGAGPGLF